jgi:hypothetical protein
VPAPGLLGRARDRRDDARQYGRLGGARVSVEGYSGNEAQGPGGPWRPRGEWHPSHQPRGPLRVELAAGEAAPAQGAHIEVVGLAYARVEGVTPGGAVDLLPLAPDDVVPERPELWRLTGAGELGRA